MANLNGKPYTRLDLLKLVGDMRQLAAAQPFELADGAERGTRCVRLYNAAGLDLDVLCDRGMSIGRCSYQGSALAMESAVGAVHPAFSEPQGLGWLRTWPVGFLSTAGLSQVGGPCNDNGVELGLHGRAMGTPARQVSCGGAWSGDEYSVSVTGTVVETAVFGDHLALTRTIRLALDEPVLWVEDTIENRGFAPAPLMFLQHINLGFPLLQPGSRLELPEHQTEPRDEAAAAGMNNYLEYGRPEPGYQEQVFYHDLTPDANGLVRVTLRSPLQGCYASLRDPNGLALTMEYAKDDYPILVQWKMMGEGLYVTGLEPANCHVSGRCAERQRGTLQTIGPWEARTFRLKIRLEENP